MKIKSMIEFIQRFKKQPPKSFGLREVIRESKKEKVTQMQLNHLLKNIFPRHIEFLIRCQNGGDEGENMECEKDYEYSLDI